jgi:acetyl esterase/lipase
MQRSIAPLILAFALAPTIAQADDPPASPSPRTPPVMVDLWPEGQMPGDSTGIGAESDQPQTPGQRTVRRIQNVTHPVLAVYPAPKETNTGTAVIIAPGGGYHILAWDLEGEEVAGWLESIGVTGIVLKYRVPRRPGDTAGEPPVWPYQDIQRAIGVVRSRAGEWGIDPNRVGVLGFSAGGHLAARAATQFESRSYPAIDDMDRPSVRPDFAVLVYPAYLAEKDGGLRAEIPVSGRTPPMFFAHASDDKLSSDNSIALYRALRDAGVPAELHVYANGGHGFGLRPSTESPAPGSWPERCAEWMRSLGLLGTKPK